MHELARTHRHQWHAGEVAYWQRRCGGDVRDADWLAPPYALELRGRWKEAAAAWEMRHCPYERARALAEGDDAARLEALAAFDELGAHPAAAALRARLRRAGIRSLPRGPRVATRSDPHGLTARQRQVADLLADGLTNGEIARRLDLSIRTVDHHVSASLEKLGVEGRREAAALLRDAQDRAPELG